LILSAKPFPDETIIVSSDKGENSIMADDLTNKYRKILIAAKRSKQLQKGARPRVDIPGAKPTRIAMTEVDRGLINVEIFSQKEK
jgi:DNA-directed RNA polymerase omega subunit